MKIQVIAGLVILVFISACQKKDDTTPDPAKVVMSVTSPAAGQTFHSGDTVFIKATVSYPGELHGYEVIVEDTSTGLILYDETQHVHSDNFVIDDQWVGTATQPLGLKLSIIASIDHDGDAARKTLNFTIIP